MRLITLTKDFAESVTVLANTAGLLSPTIRIITPKSRVYTYRHLSDLILKMVATGGAELSQASTLLWAVRKPTSRSPTDISGIQTYAAFFNTPLIATAGEKTQFDQETMARRRVNFLPGTDVQLSQDQILELLLNATTAVDWTETGSVFEWTIIESDVVTQVAQ